MASLSIPEPIVTGLTIIATLSNESFQELFLSFEGMPLKIHQHRVFDSSFLKIESISPEDTKSIAGALFPIVLGQTSSKTPITEYVDSVVDSLKQAGKEGTEFAQTFPQTEEAFAVLKERLSHLLSVKSLQLVAKAHGVLLEHAQTFNTARVVSDIRPVFGEKAEDPPVAAVIVHMLNIAYYSSDDRQEFVVAMDTKDIEILMDALQRARAKTESLQSVIKSTNMTYIEVA